MPAKRSGQRSYERFAEALLSTEISSRESSGGRLRIRAAGSPPTRRRPRQGVVGRRDAPGLVQRCRLTPGFLRPHRSLHAVLLRTARRRPSPPASSGPSPVTRSLTPTSTPWSYEFKRSRSASRARDPSRHGCSAGTQSGMAATSGTTIPKRSPMAARLAACRAIEETVSVGPGSARVAVALAITVAE